MATVKEINILYNKRTQESLEQALAKSLDLREIIDKDKAKYSQEIGQFYHLDSGLNAQIFNCMKLLKKYDNMIPYLESTLQYLNNDKNPTLWRLLGLLYLVKGKNLDKACEAWEKAIYLDSSLVQRYPGLNVVYVYNTMKKEGKSPSWEVLSADIESGEFSVKLN